MKPPVAAAVILVALAAGGLAHALKVEALERGRTSFCLVDRTRS